MQWSRRETCSSSAALEQDQRAPASRERRVAARVLPLVPMRLSSRRSRDARFQGLAACSKGLESAVSFRARRPRGIWPDDRLAFMEVDRAAPVVAESSIEVAAAPEVVWDTIADFERWPAWNTDVRSMSLDGPVAEGTTFRWKAGPGTITSTLRSVERPREIGWTGKTLGIHAVHVWRFEPRGGRTFVRTAESFAGWVPRLLRGRVREQLQKSLDAGLPRLRAEAERRAPG
jgi:hypothetical protein